MINIKNMDYDQNMNLDISHLSLDYIAKKYNVKLLTLAKKIIFCEETAKDIVQDSYLDFFINLSRYKGKASVFTYLYRIVINKSIDYLRKNKSRKKVENIFKDKICVEQNEIEIKIIVCEALEKINLKYRIPLILLEYENQNYEEISKILNISVNNVKIRIFRARQKLIKIFKIMEVDNYVL